MAVEEAKIGRPTDYRPEFCKQAEALCKLGATCFELAEFFEVSERTIYRWQIEHPEFCHSLKAGKEVADDRVERALYHRALGYSHKSTKIFMPAGAESPVYAEFVEHYPPDVTAGIFWLKNRRGADWRANPDGADEAGPAPERVQVDVVDGDADPQ